MIEEELFKEYKAYMLANSIFKDALKVYPNTPQTEIAFPTIIMREINNRDYARGKTFERSEGVSTISYRVSIYAKPTIVSNNKYQPKQIINELRSLTSKFFNNVGLNRDSDTPVDNINASISRQEMLFSGKVANWNNSLYF